MSTATRPPTLLQGEGVLFDFNGTLSDDEGILRDVFIHVAATEFSLTLTARQYQEDLAGRSDTEILGHIITLAAGAAGEAGTGNAAGWPLAATAAHLDSRTAEIERLLPLIDAKYQARVAAESPIRPATRELVHALHAAGLKLGVVTGASRLQVLPALERAGLLDQFGVVVTDEDVHRGKPHPEGFLRAAAALGLEDPSRVVAFEDSLPGLGAVAAAGMTAVCVEGTHPPEILRLHARILVPEISMACLELSLS